MKKVLLLSLFVMVFSNEVYGKHEDHKHDAFYRNSRIGKGINLGNAFEAPTEGEWGVRLEKAYFDIIAKAGFNSVRIPIRWSAHAKSTPALTGPQTATWRRVWELDADGQTRKGPRRRTWPR